MSLVLWEGLHVLQIFQQVNVVAAERGSNSTVGRALTVATHLAQGSGGSLCGCGMEVSFKVFYPPDRNAGPRG